MSINNTLEAINLEIARLEKAKQLLGCTKVPAKPGRKAAGKKRSGKRTLSAEGRARIAAAQKARWAKQNKTNPSVK